MKFSVGDVIEFVDEIAIILLAKDERYFIFWVDQRPYVTSQSKKWFEEYAYKSSING